MSSAASPAKVSSPHVLYVAWGFPPMAGGGTYRTLATANVLAEVGFKVTVLTAERSAYVGFTDVDDSLEQAIDPRVAVRRVPFFDPQIEFDIRNWSRERATDPREWLQEFLDKVPFPEPRFGQWHDTVCAAAEEVHAEQPVDLVIGSANPHVDLSVGYHLRQLHGIPYVIDHRDAWRLNWYVGEEANADARIAEVETALMEGADQVWFVNDAIRGWHQNLYPQAASKMRVVQNGFDAEFAPTPPLTGPSPDEPLRFTYIGALSSVVPLTEFVEGWVRARRQSPEIARATARIYGPFRPGDHDTPRLLAAGSRFGIEYCGSVPKQGVAGVYENSDVLMLILAGGRYVTSGKVYEYISSGLPVVSVHDPESGAADVLSDYPLWVPTDGLSVEQVADALIRAAELARSADGDLRQRSASFARGMERRAQLRGPLDELLQVVRGSVSETA